MAGPFNEFHSISAVANGAVTAYRFVKLDSANKAVQCVAADAYCDGIAKYTVADTEMTDVMYDGEPLMVEAAASQTAGTEVQADANGRATAATGGFAFGKLLTASTNAGDLVQIQLYRRGQKGGINQAPTVISASGAIAVRPSTNYMITKAGVAAMTIAAPTAGTDDGVVIIVSSDTANAHTITFTGNTLDSGSANVALATFAAQKGAGVTLEAYNGRWKALSQIGITFS